jgi:L,D-peptidoglycan transpeptidase YkuD (ErfK/YbiS/YcfS/YnhG family)
MRFCCFQFWASLLSLLAATPWAAADSPEVPAPSAEQLLLVIVPDWQATDGTLQRFDRSESGEWSAAGPLTRVTVGRSGCGWGIGCHPPQSNGPTKQEGDGRSPAGIFTLGTAFGNEPRLETKLPYLPLDEGHWCIDVATSPLYNKIVHEKDAGRAAINGSSEPMRRDIHLDGDLQYRLGFVIEHNPNGQPAAGSCIFAHPWVNQHTPTAGCVAMAERSLRETLAWLDVSKKPHLALLPRDAYQRLQAMWHLPASSGLDR